AGPGGGHLESVGLGAEHPRQARLGLGQDRAKFRPAMRKNRQRQGGTHAFRHRTRPGKAQTVVEWDDIEPDERRCADIHRRNPPFIRDMVRPYRRSNRGSCAAEPRTAKCLAGARFSAIAQKASRFYNRKKAIAITEHDGGAMTATSVDYAHTAFDLIDEFDQIGTPEQVMERLASALSVFGYTAFLITGVPDPPQRVEPYFLLNG